MTQPKIELRIYTLHSVEYREQMVPYLYIIIESFTPHSCPWDYYGMKKCKEWKNVMKAAGIPCETLQTNKKHLSPTGTGPGGSIRTGDDWMPGEYRLVVPKHKDTLAREALLDHRAEVSKWLDKEGPMPEALK